MTTNQTIDGVPRELLADILHQLETKAVSFVTVGKLRALLDAKSCGACNGCSNDCRLDVESPPASTS